MNTAQSIIDELIYKYFEVTSVEKVLVEDTIATIIRSTRPSKASERIPTLKPSNREASRVPGSSSPL